MVFVAGGRFSETFMRPVSWKILEDVRGTDDLCVDETEVTVADYRECVVKSRCVPSHIKPLCTAALTGDYPINCVDAAQAAAYCSFRGRRVPTTFEAEWSRRGGQSDLPHDSIAAVVASACVGPNAPCKVRSFPSDRNGLFDTTGNVLEWTSTTRYLLTGDNHAVSGGYYNSDAGDFFENSQFFVPSKWFSASTGIRCVWSPRDDR